MDKLVLHIVFLLTLFIANAQENLVPNSSFEEYNWCPYQTFSVDGFHIDACKYWTSPTMATPDYFNSCSTQFDSSLGIYLFSVPQNYAGNQPAHSGNAYAFFGFAQNEIGSQTYSEYVQIKLNKELIAGKFYKVQFFIHNPRVSYCINSVGALFTSEQLNLNTDQIIQIDNQVNSDPAIFFCDTNKWYEVSSFFAAKGGEKYITIGVFKQLPELLVTDYHGNPILDFPSSYLYVDDVSVVETEVEMPNIFTPNGDGVNDTYFLDLKKIGALNAEIFNRWGNRIVYSETSLDWNGTFNGQDCPDGVYFVRIQFENNIVNGFIHLMK